MYDLLDDACNFHRVYKDNFEESMTWSVHDLNYWSVLQLPISLGTILYFLDQKIAMLWTSFTCGDEISVSERSL